jgi:hypothetical protein
MSVPHPAFPVEDTILQVKLLQELGMAYSLYQLCFDSEQIIKTKVKIML